MPEAVLDAASGMATGSCNGMGFWKLQAVRRRSQHNPGTCSVAGALLLQVGMSTSVSSTINLIDTMTTSSLSVTQPITILKHQKAR